MGTLFTTSLDQTRNHCCSHTLLITHCWVLSCGLAEAVHIYKGKVHLWWISGPAVLIKESLLIYRMDGIIASLDLRAVHHWRVVNSKFLFSVLPGGI